MTAGLGFKMAASNSKVLSNSKFSVVSYSGQNVLVKLRLGGLLVVQAPFVGKR